MKTNKLLKLVSIISIFTVFLSILIYPSFSNAQSNTKEIKELENIEKNLKEENSFVVIDAKTQEVVDEITTEELSMKSRSITTNHTDPYKVPLRKSNNISSRVIIGGDERTEVSHPYNEIAYLEINMSEKVLCGTAVMVYKNLAVTAAHNIFNGTLATGTEVFPERVEGNAPYGSALVYQYVLSKSYYENLDDNEDWCLLILDRNIGEQSGWQGIAYSDDYSYYANGENVNVTGYPEEKGVRQYTATGPVKIANNNFLYYDIDSTGGQSGGAVYDKNGYVIGVHKGGSNNPFIPWNRGSNINKERFEIIVSYMN